MKFMSGQPKTYPVSPKSVLICSKYFCERRLHTFLVFVDRERWFCTFLVCRKTYLRGFSYGRFRVLPPRGVRVFRPLPPTAHLRTKRGGVMMIMMMICIDSYYDDDYDDDDYLPNSGNCTGTKRVRPKKITTLVRFTPFEGWWWKQRCKKWQLLHFGIKHNG